MPRRTIPVIENETIKEKSIQSSYSNNSFYLIFLIIIVLVLFNGFDFF